MNSKDEAILRVAHETWMQNNDMRQRRARYKRFTYGDQWGDIETSGKTAADKARAQGREPITNNLIRRMVKTVIGRFRNMRADILRESPRDPELDRLYTANCLDELDCRALEEFLISGCAVQRVEPGRRPEGDGRWVDNVSPSRFFINSISDPRGWDTQLTGMLHDMSVTQIMMKFAHGDRLRASQLRGIFTNGEPRCRDRFFTPAGTRQCRVIEVWTLECRELLRCHDRDKATCFIIPIDREAAVGQENRRRAAAGKPGIETRWTVATRWHCRWFAPTGEILDEYDSPYRHGSHPFVFKLFPLIDGEIHSLVEDVVDQQIHVNRLITLIDHIMSTAAKGVLLFPAEQKIDGMAWQDIGNLWGRPDSIIPFRPRHGQPLPKQVTVNGGDLGARQLLDLQLRMFEEVSGMNAALTGNLTAAGTGYEHYRMLVDNALVTLIDTLQTFIGFLAERDRRLLASDCPR